MVLFFWRTLLAVSILPSSICSTSLIDFDLHRSFKKPQTENSHLWIDERSNHPELFRCFRDMFFAADRTASSQP